MNRHSDKKKLISIDESFVSHHFLRKIQKYVCYVKYPKLTRICGVCLFISVSIIIGVVVVCVASQKKTNNTCRLSFKKSVEPASGYDSQPQHVAVGDFNKDGYLDIIIANFGTDNVGLFLGYGNGTFQNQIPITTGFQSHPYSLAVGDFNNDTQLDLVVANFGTNSIGVLLGCGNGSFASPLTTSLGSSRPISIATGHFNKDNYLDIAVVNYGTSTITILLSFNNGSFQIHTIYHMGYDSIPYSLIVEDFNKDNQQDIAVVNYGTSNLAILLANQNGSFSTYNYSTGNGSHPTSLAAADFNNDKILDIVVTNSDTSCIGIFLGSENGMFRNMMKYSTGINSHPQSLVATKFNNDTNVDIIIIDSGNNNVIVLNGNGYGNFTIITTHSTGFQSQPSSITIGDFDNDNKPDIAITNNATNNLLVLTAYSPLTAMNQTTYPAGNNFLPIFVTVGDVNNDNFLDIIATTNGINSASIFINLGNGTFANKSQISSGNNTEYITLAVVDVNNDKQLDIILGLNQITEIQILLGYGNGSFSFNNSYSTGEGYSPASIAVGDLNNDHNIDIAVVNYDSITIGILLGYGNGSFTNITTYSINRTFNPRFITMGDFNNDQILDILASDRDLPMVIIFLGYGNGSLDIPLTVLTDDDSPYSLVIADLNNDHLLDIVYVNPYSSVLCILFGYGNGTFGDIKKYSIESGSWPWSVSVGHFNKDNLLDIVVANAYGFNVGIFFGLGNRSFASQKTFPTKYGSRPTFITVADLNNDNQQDIIVTNQNTNDIGVFLIHYEFDFTYETSYFTGSSPHPYSVAINDFDKDNRSDVVVAHSGNDNIQLLLNYNDGSFMNTITYSTGFHSYPQIVNVADFNRDNQLDIIVANNRNSTIAVFLTSDNDTFDGPIIYSTGSGSLPSSIAIGDFNKDNWTDIVVANNGTNNIQVFLGFNYATFTNETIYISGNSSVPLYIAVGDFNNDTQWDIVVAYGQINRVGVYLGYGNGTFEAPKTFSTGQVPYSIGIGDFNNDDQLDIVVANRDGDSISILLGYGNGSFQSHKEYSTGESSSPVSLVVVDVNQDNLLDIVVANRFNTYICIFIGYGNGTFVEQRSPMLPSGSYPALVLTDDINNDKILDIIVLNQNSISIIFGFANGTFRDVLTFSTGDNSRPFGIATGHLNNDAWLDIVFTARNSKSISILFGYGNGTFSSSTMYPIGSQSDLRLVVIHDANNDGNSDIIFSDRGSGNGNIGVFYGYGDGNFTTLKTYWTGFNTHPLSIVICDFNNDNQSDFAITYQNKDSIGIMLRRKSEPFSTPLIFSTGNDSHPKSIAIGDLNNDNQLDIAVANSGTNTIGILLGNRSGTFSQQQTYSTGNDSEPVSITLGDVNNDHYLDAVVANAKANTIAIFHGYGNGSITFANSYSTGVRSIPSCVALKSLKDDGYLDIIVSNFGSNDVVIFYGFNNGTFLDPESYTLGYNSRPQSVAIGDINNDSFLDIVVANYGTDYVEVLLQKCLHSVNN